MFWEKEKVMKVKALDTYERLGVRDAELDRIPKAGDILTVSDERAKVLLCENSYGQPFVEVIKTKKAAPKNKAMETENK